jgi:hypothetical protein
VQITGRGRREANAGSRHGNVRPFYSLGPRTALLELSSLLFRHGDRGGRRLA